MMLGRFIYLEFAKQIIKLLFLVLLTLTLSKQGRPQSTGIFSATRLLQKKVWRRRGLNPRPADWEGKHEKFQATARVRTQDLLDGKAKSEVDFIQSMEWRQIGGLAEFVKKTRHRS